MFGYLMVEEDADISADTATVTPPVGSQGARSQV
jgi:hypothetical protein